MQHTVLSFQFMTCAYKNIHDEEVKKENALIYMYVNSYMLNPIQINFKKLFFILYALP